MLKPTLVVLATVLLAGCGSHGLTTVQAQALAAKTAAAKAADTAAPPANGPATKAEFVAAAKAKGISFTDEQLAELQVERTLTPNGTWAARPAENLTGPQNLQVHFLKHGAQFRPALPTAEAYIAQGNAAAVGKRGKVRFFFDTTSFDKGYQSHIVRWVPTTHDFTAFKPTGEETTYYTNDPQASRFIEVPVW